MKTKFLLLSLLVAFVFNLELKAQSGVMNVNDPIITYDELNPPSFPPYGTLSDWVRTVRVNWNTDSYKCYFYKGMPFRLKFPKNYDSTGTKKYPMIVMFHGRGNYATSLYDNEKPLHTGGDGGKRYRDAVDNDEFDGFVMFPQNTNGFFNNTHYDALHELFINYMPELHIDINRISLTGSSAGAYSVWNAAIAHPEDYCSILPMSGISTNNIPGLPDMREVIVWYTQGGKDKSPTPYTANLVRNAADSLGMTFKYTEYENSGHGIWSKVYSEPDLLPYMLRHNKTNPVVYYGKTEFCPGDPIQATLALTDGYDAYEWRKDGIVINGATSHQLSVNQIGTYEARFKRGNTWTYWSVDPVVLQMKDSTITPPIEVVGTTTHVIPGPDSLNEITLTVAGEFETYEWKLSGTSTVLGSDATFTTSTPGNYVVSVVEKFGCQSSDSPVFSVLDASAPNGPGAPSGLNVFPVSKTSLKIAWNDNPNNTLNETAFEIYRSEISGGQYEFIGTVPSNITEYFDEELLSNTTYYYVVRGINLNAASAITSEAHATTLADNILPTAPVNLSLVSTTTNSLSIKWNASKDDVVIERYEVYIAGVKVVVTTDTFATVYNLLPYQTYNITVKARDFSSNYSPSSLPVTAMTVFSGLDYKYYEGAWSNLPNFRNLTAVDSGHVENIDISLKQVTDDYGFLWEGFINIPVAGNYTFETRSDDGSKVYIGGYDTGVVVVDNDGTHSARYRSGTYNFPAAGAYPIAITFFRNGGSETMQLYWKNTAHGIGSSRQIIPNSAFSDEMVFPGNPPKSPGDLQATAVSYNQIDLTWADSSNNETGFVVFRKGANGEYIPITTTAANITSYSDKNLKASTTYSYKIVAIGNYGVSAAASGNSEFALNFNNNLTDQSGNLVSSLENGAGFTTNSYEGSHALHLDGVNDYVKLGPGNGLFHDEFTGRTVAMWVKIEDHTGTRIIYDEGGTGQGLAIRTNNGQLEVAIRQSSNQFNIGASFSDTNWAHIAVVYDAGRISLYVNSALVAENPNIGYSTITGHSNGAGLGGTNGNNAFNNNGNETKGSFDDLFVYSTALTVPQIQSVMLRNSIFDKATTFDLPATPSAPSNLTVTALSTSVAQLNWNDNSNNEEQFSVYRSTGTGTNYTSLGVVLGDSTTGPESYSDSGLLANTDYNYIIVATNAGGADTSAISSVTMPNNPPELDETQDIQVRYNTTESLQLLASDMDNDSITLSTVNLPSFATLTDYNDGSGLISLSPLISDTNEYPNVIVIATDAFGGISSDTFTISVIHNFLPTIASIADVSLDEGDSTSFTVTAKDSNGVAALAWSTSDLPSFVTFTPSNNGTALVTVAPDYADGGSYFNLEIMVDDNKGGTAVEYFNINVNEINPNRTVKVNFRHNVAAASPWNNVNSVNPTALNDDNGNPTGMSVDILGTVWNSFNVGRTTGNNTGIVPDDVLKEYYYFGIFGAPNVVEFNITGLNSTGAYNLSFVSSSEWNGTPNNGTTKFTIGNQTDSVYAHYNTSESADFELVNPNNNGDITVSMSKAVGTTVGYINGFVLEEIYNYGATPDAARNLVAFHNEQIVELNWYDAPYNENGYNIFRSDSANGTYVQINNVVIPANSTTFNDSTIQLNTEYFYKIQAYNNNGVSAFSEVAYVATGDKSLQIIGQDSIEVNEGEITTSYLTIINNTNSGNVSWSGINIPDFVTMTPLTGDSLKLDFEPSFMHGGPYNDFKINAVVGSSHASIELNLNIGEVNPNKSLYVNYKFSFTPGAPWFNINSVLPTQLKYEDGQASTIVADLDSPRWFAFNLGAKTGNNSGMVPDYVLRDYFLFGPSNTIPTLDLFLTGLNPDRQYNIDFVSSIDGTTANGYTIFEVNGMSDSVHTEKNTSKFVSFEGLEPDSTDALTIHISKSASAAYGLLNAFILEEVYDYGAVPATGRMLTANFIGNAVQLNWYDAPFNETGYNVYRSNSLHGPYYQINFIPLPANSTSFIDFTSSIFGTYFYKIKAVNEHGESEFSKFATPNTPNTEPELELAGDHTVKASNILVVNTTATDVDNDILTFSSSDLPSFATLNQVGNGNATITINPDAGELGNYSFSVKVEDDSGAFVTKEFNFSVTENILSVVKINFNQYPNAAGPSPWNNMNRAAVNGDSLVNVVDENNTATGINMYLESAFGGVFNKGAVTGDNSGIVPDNVLREYYWFGAFGSPQQVQLRISNLDNTKKYRFKFLGSSVFNDGGVTDNGETIYTIGNQSVALDVQGNNSNFAVLTDVIADNNGNVIITISKASGVLIGYINALVIETLPGDQVAFDPKDLTATATSSSAVELNWLDNSFDETDYIIERCTTGLEIDFTPLDTVSANTVSYTDNALLSGTVYYYRVRGKRNVGYTAYTNVAASGTIAYKVYININGDAQYNAPAPWNNLGIAASNDDVFTGFNNDLGNPSGLEMVWNNAMAGSNEWGTNTGNNSGVYPDLVMQSFFFSDAFDPQAEITMRGLSQAFTYNFKFFGAIVTGFDIRTKFNIGNTTVINSQSNNTTDVAEINGVTPDNNNEIDINLYEDAGSNWAIFNAMVIEAVTAIPLGSNKEKAEIETSEDGNRIAVTYGRNAPEISVYPNPFNGDRFMIGYKDAVIGNIEIIITDLTGRMVKVANYNINSQNGQIEINLTDLNLEHGVYIVTTRFSNGSNSTARVVKAQ